MVRTSRLRNRRIRVRRQAGREGQATIEYILLLSTIALLYTVVIGGMRQIGLTEKITQSLSGKFARAYQYGHVEALGPENGGPKNHPRMGHGDNNFRVFINPVYR